MHESAHIKRYSTANCAHDEPEKRREALAKCARSRRTHGACMEFEDDSWRLQDVLVSNHLALAPQPVNAAGQRESKLGTSHEKRNAVMWVCTRFGTGSERHSGATQGLIGTVVMDISQKRHCRLQKIALPLEV